jgi:hypothetical protein
MLCPKYTKSGDLKHSDDCKMSFGRKDLRCPRCIELSCGAAPRAGWQKDHFATKANHEATRLSAIRAHDFMACMKRNVVCTCFDW